MNLLKSGLILLLSMFLINTNLSAQKDYKSLSNSDGLEFSYKWKNSKICKKDSPLMLLLMIRNTNDFHADVTFTVDYFWQGIRKASSEPNQICIKSGKTAKGKLKKLTFDRATFTDEDLLNENFTLDISEIAITPVSRCVKR